MAKVIIPVNTARRKLSRAYLAGTLLSATTTYGATSEALIPAASWSPYGVGAAIGLLVCISLVAANKPVGASSGYSALAGILSKFFTPQKTARLGYYKNHSTSVDWTLVFLCGTILGGFIAAFTGDEITARFLAPLWIEKFGDNSYLLRALTAFTGGLFLAFGARLAGGCTSGHGISGTSQLSVASWVSVLCFFIGGVITASLLIG